MRISRSLAVVACGAIVFLCIGSSAAQSPKIKTPCGPAEENAPFPGTKGLWYVGDGNIVWDENLEVCWLTNANLAGDPAVRNMVTLSSTNPDGSMPVINPDGTMDYETALNWVDSLNSYNGGKGWLNHNTWQLPATPLMDPTCSSVNLGNFGIQCTNSALSNLYYVGLKKHYPASTGRFTFDVVGPFFGLDEGLYWTSDVYNPTKGQGTFSFNNGQSGANTTRYNLFHVLPISRSTLGTPPSGTGVLGYTSGPAKDIAVYDTTTGNSWPVDANLPAVNRFGVTGKTTLTEEVNKNMVTVPWFNNSGAVYFSAIDPSQPTGWIVEMNKKKYGGASDWELPQIADLQQLYTDLGLEPGDVRLEWNSPVGPFQSLQAGFYWSCERDAYTSVNGPCDPSVSPTPAGENPGQMRYSFNFDDGFLGTDDNSKEFFVTVYYPAPSSAAN